MHHTIGIVAHRPPSLLQCSGDMQNQQLVFAAVMASSNGQQQEAPELAMFNPSSEPDRAVALNVQQQQQQQQLPDAAHNHLLQQQNAISFSTVSQANMTAPSANMYSDSMIMVCYFFFICFR